jgi:hypothetical protein
VIVGALGTVLGVLLTDGELGLPCPAEFTAEILKSYDKPLVRPVTVPVVFVETPSEKIDHVVGSLVSLYSMT